MWLILNTTCWIFFIYCILFCCCSGTALEEAGTTTSIFLTWRRRHGASPSPRWGNGEEPPYKCHQHTHTLCRFPCRCAMFIFSLRIITVHTERYLGVVRVHFCVCMLWCRETAHYPEQLMLVLQLVTGATCLGDDTRWGSKTKIVFVFSLLVVIDVPDLLSGCSHIHAHLLLFNSECCVIRSTELQTKWSVLPWPGHMGVAWNVSSVLFFYFHESQCRVFFHVSCFSRSLTFPPLC